jgi:hypothetical protein
VVVEAVDVDPPFTWAHTSMLNISKVNHNLHMLWIYKCMSTYHVITLSSASHQQKLLWYSNLAISFVFIGQTTACAVVEAVDPFKWAPTSILNTYKVYHNPNLICCGCA